jgi:hypothetical protein
VTNVTDTRQAVLKLNPGGGGIKTNKKVIRGDTVCAAQHSTAGAGRSAHLHSGGHAHGKARHSRPHHTAATGSRTWQRCWRCSPDTAPPALRPAFLNLLYLNPRPHKLFLQFVKRARWYHLAYHLASDGHAAFSSLQWLA